MSAGLVFYRMVNGRIEVLLAHPADHFSKKDEGHWTIPKGQPDEGEELADRGSTRVFQEVEPQRLRAHLSRWELSSKKGVK